jgi:hypothetical protein
MRAHIITIIVVLGALAIPVSAGASPVDGGYSSVNSITGASGDSGQPPHGADYSSVNSITGGSTESSSPAVDSGYSSLNAIAGPSTDQPTFASGSPAAGDQFDWSDAALGAGAALALVAFGSVALLTVRRRTAISPSASTS